MFIVFYIRQTVRSAGRRVQQHLKLNAQLLPPGVGQRIHGRKGDVSLFDQSVRHRSGYNTTMKGVGSISV